MLPSTTQVLIVGAGPAGLALATTLAQDGVDFVLVDRLAEGQHTSRAAVIHAHTLEVLERLGVSAALVARGLRIARFAVLDRDRPLLRLPFDGLPTPHPYLLMLPQDETEAVLAARLRAAGGTIHRGVTVEAVAQGVDGATASVVAGGVRRAIAARFVVGADGMHSVVREAAGIGFGGAAYDASFILADVGLEWGHGRDEVKLFFSPAGLVVVAPLPDGRFRIVATVAEAPEHPGIADVQALLDARGPTRGAARVTSLAWSSRFRVHHRLADRYRNGRLLLVGDAAHVHSPAGGQGMNAGLIDAWVLGRTLAATIKEGRDEAHLDGYERLRRPAAAAVLRLAGRLTRAATMRSRPQRALRNLMLSLAGSVPPLRRRIAMDLSGLSRRELAGLQP